MDILIANILFGLTLFGALVALLHWSHRRTERMKRVNRAVNVAVRRMVELAVAE